MNPKAVDLLVSQRYHALVADARGDQLLARVERAAPGATSPGEAPAALFGRLRFAVPIRRFHSPAREASGGRF